MEGQPMRYLLIVAVDQTELERMSNAEKAQLTTERRAFLERLVANGAFLAGEALESATTATTVRLRSGKRVVSDGPLTAGREQLVGYYLIEARDLDEALGIAARVPSARVGAVEVRPVKRLAPYSS